MTPERTFKLLTGSELIVGQNILGLRMFEDGETVEFPVDAADVIDDVLAALEESQQQKVELWECEDCGFAFPAMYEDDTPEGGHSCPVCAETRLEKELVEAQQTIARQREAMDRASDMINHKHAAYRVLQYALLLSEEGSDKAPQSTGEGGECTCVDCGGLDSGTWVCKKCQDKRDLSYREGKS